jgi:hypothetical protein
MDHSSNRYEVLFFTSPTIPTIESNNPDDYERLGIFVNPLGFGDSRTAGLLTAVFISPEYQEHFSKLNKGKLALCEKNEIYLFNEGMETEIQINVPTPAGYQKRLTKILGQAVNDIEAFGIS